MHKLIEKYKDCFKSYEDFKVKIENLIRELLTHSNINFHKIESRLKDPVRLEEKISRKNDKYTDLSEITDIIGIRIITYFEDEVDKVAAIFESEFVIDKENSIDKRKLDADKFGYKSLHYVVSLNGKRDDLPEYKRFNGIKIEIQIRSILQHAWAEIEHDMGYKGEHAIPDMLKRNFYRVAALLETADIEFVNIKTKLKGYEETVGETIKTHPEEVEINAASLRSFAETNELVNKLTKIMVEKFGFTIAADRPRYESYVEKLLYLNIKTIKQLEKTLVENQYKIIPFAEKWIGKSKIRTVSDGILFFYLCYVLVGQKNDLEFAITYYEQFIYKSTPPTKSKGSIIVDTYNKIT